MSRIKAHIDIVHVMVSLGLLSTLVLQLLNPASVLELALLNQVTCQIWVWLCR